MKTRQIPDKYPGHHVPGGGTDMNRLRAAVLGANDGIVSVASIVVGVAGAANNRGILLAAGVAGLVAGALSMAVGEYVSVSSQRDTEKALIEMERKLLEKFPEEELEELTEIYLAKGLTEATARQVASELSELDAALAHFDAELGINPDDLTNPWQAAWASAISFTIGASIPLIAILTPPADLRIPVAFASVIVALVITGLLSARASGARWQRATRRVVIGGVVAMVITFAIGHLVGISGV